MLSSWPWTLSVLMIRRPRRESRGPYSADLSSRPGIVDPALGNYLPTTRTHSQRPYTPSLRIHRKRSARPAGSGVQRGRQEHEHAPREPRCRVPDPLGDCAEHRLPEGCTPVGEQCIEREDRGALGRGDQRVRVGAVDRRLDAVTHSPQDPQDACSDHRPPSRTGGQGTDCPIPAMRAESATAVHTRMVGAGSGRPLGATLVSPYARYKRVAEDPPERRDRLHHADEPDQVRCREASACSSAMRRSRRTGTRLQEAMPRGEVGMRRCEHRSERPRRRSSSSRRQSVRGGDRVARNRPRASEARSPRATAAATPLARCRAARGPLGPGSHRPAFRRASRPRTSSRPRRTRGPSGLSIRWRRAHPRAKRRSRPFGSRNRLPSRTLPTMKPGIPHPIRGVAT